MHTYGIYQDDRLAKGNGAEISILEIKNGAWIKAPF